MYVLEEIIMREVYSNLIISKFGFLWRKPLLTFHFLDSPLILLSLPQFQPRYVEEGEEEVSVQTKLNKPTWY